MKLPTIALVHLALSVAPSWYLCNAAVLSNQESALAMAPPQSGPWQNCNPAENTVIDTALGQFRLLGRAVGKMYTAARANPPSPDAVNLWHKWFGNVATASANRQQANDQILRRLAWLGTNGGQPLAAGQALPQDQPFFECGGVVGNCDDLGAYTMPGGPTVTLCKNFFDTKDLNLRTLIKSPKDYISAGIIAHECTHSRRIMAFNLATDDIYTPGGRGRETYGYDASLALAANPESAINNADNYKFYSQEAYKAYCCSQMDMNGDNPTAEKTEICNPLWTASSRKCTIL